MADHQSTPKRYKIIAKRSDGKELEVLTVTQGAGSQWQAVRVQARTGILYELQELGSQEGAPKKLAFKRVRNDLQIFFEGELEADIVIEGYFGVMQRGPHGVIGQGPDGRFYEYIPSESGEAVLLAQDGQQTMHVALGGPEVVQASAAMAGMRMGDWLDVAGVGAAVALTAAGVKGDSGASASETAGQSSAEALKAIKDAAEGNSAFFLTVKTYESAGVTGVTTENLSAIHSALNSASITGAKVDTKEKLQALVDACKSILDEANDTDASAGDKTADATPTSDPTAAQYAAIGATIGTAATDAENLALLNDIVGASQKTDVDTIAEIDTLARIANAIQLVAAGGTASPLLTVADLTKIGLSGATTENLQAIMNAIAAKSDDGKDTDSLAELQAIVNNAIVTHNNALAAIKTAAENNDATASSPSVQQYSDAGISGVTSSNLSAINNALNTASVSGAAADSTAEIQTIVSAFNAILAEANDINANAGDGTPDATPNSDPTAAQYAAIGADIGAAKSDAENLALLNDIIGASQKTDVDSIAKIDEFARIANAIQQTAAAGTPTQALTHGDLSKIGLSGVDANNLATVLGYIKVQDDSGSATDSLSKLQALVNAANASKVSPVVLDFNGDGILGYTQQLIDINSDGVMDFSAWAGPQEGVLVRDANHDGKVSGAAEFAFSRHADETDLQGLAAQFDGNRDGVLDARDAAFAEFSVWRDANGNGISDAGELRSLLDIGLKSIALQSDGVQRTPAADVIEAGRSIAIFEDGRQMLVADAAFMYSPTPLDDSETHGDTSNLAAPPGGQSLQGLIDQHIALSNLTLS